jgi:hypothetical protein
MPEEEYGDADEAFEDSALERELAGDKTPGSATPAQPAAPADPATPAAPEPLWQAGAPSLPQGSGDPLPVIPADAAGAEGDPLADTQDMPVLLLPPSETDAELLRPQAEPLKVNLASLVPGLAKLKAEAPAVAPAATPETRDVPHAAEPASATAPAVGTAARKAFSAAATGVAKRAAAVALRLAHAMRESLQLAYYQFYFLPPAAKRQVLKIAGTVAVLWIGSLFWVRHETLRTIAYQKPRALPAARLAPFAPAPRAAAPPIAHVGAKAPSAPVSPRKLATAHPKAGKAASKAKAKHAHSKPKKKAKAGSLAKAKANRARKPAALTRAD